MPLNLSGSTVSEVRYLLLRTVENIPDVGERQHVQCS